MKVDDSTVKQIVLFVKGTRNAKIILLVSLNFEISTNRLHKTQRKIQLLSYVKGLSPKGG